MGELLTRENLHDYQKYCVDFIEKNYVAGVLLDLGLGKTTILPIKSCSNISAKKIDNIATKLEKGKKMKPIKLALVEGKVYIVDGIHRYLASLKTGKNIVKEFVNTTPTIGNVNVEEWNKVVESYKA